MAIKKFLSTVVFVSLFSFLVFPSQVRATHWDGDSGDLDLYVVNSPGGDLSLKINFNTTQVVPDLCNFEVYDYPGIYSAASTCLIEMESTECEVGSKGNQTCSANAVLAVDLTNHREVKYYKSLSAPPIEGKCYPITQTEQIDLEFIRLGALQIQGTGELCVMSDEPGLAGVTIYSDVNFNGVYRPEGRVSPVPVLGTSQGTVLEDDAGTTSTFMKYKMAPALISSTSSSSH